MRAIPRKNWEPIANSAVCIKHFHECDIIKADTWESNGEIKQIPLRYPKLKAEAIPNIFNNLTKYLSYQKKKFHKE